MSGSGRERIARFVSGKRRQQVLHAGVMTDRREVGRAGDHVDQRPHGGTPVPCGLLGNEHATPPGADRTALYQRRPCVLRRDRVRTPPPSTWVALRRSVCSMDEVSVRRLGAADEVELQRFEAAFDHALDPLQAAEFLRDPRHHIIVAEVGGEPAGFVSATEILHPDKAPEMFLNELGVVEHLRRRGAATALITELQRLSEEVGCVAIWVLTDEGNQPANRTYTATGGHPDGARYVMFEYDVESR
jgi:GNAT superfamily N-acetyltransferase